MLPFLKVNHQMNEFLSGAMCPLCQQNSKEEKLRLLNTIKPLVTQKCPTNASAFFILLNVWKQDQNNSLFIF